MTTFSDEWERTGQGTRVCVCEVNVTLFYFPILLSFSAINIIIV